MSNLYGVANAPGLVQVQNTAIGAAVACPANTDTLVLTTPSLVAPSQGYFFAMAWYSLSVAFGATIPTGMNSGLAIGAGAIFNRVSFPANGWVASTNLDLTFCNASAPSQTAWLGAGSVLNIYLNPGAQGVTVNPFTYCVSVLFRAPDQ